VIRVKPGVEFAVVAPAGFLILQALRAASDELGVDLTITSGTDGAHSGPADPHHRGEAYDVRSHDLDPAVRARTLGLVMVDLGWQRFFGFIESPETPNAHFHFQKKKGTAFTVADLLAFEPPTAGKEST
jgi:hypothetical protein